MSCRLGCPPKTCAGSRRGNAVPAADGCGGATSSPAAGDWVRLASCGRRGPVRGGTSTDGLLIKRPLTHCGCMHGRCSATRCPPPPPLSHYYRHRGADGCGLYVSVAAHFDPCHTKCAAKSCKALGLVGTNSQLNDSDYLEKRFLYIRIPLRPANTCFSASARRKVPDDARDAGCQRFRGGTQFRRQGMDNGNGLFVDRSRWGRSWGGQVHCARALRLEHRASTGDGDSAPAAAAGQRDSSGWRGGGGRGFSHGRQRLRSAAGASNGVAGLRPETPE